MAEHRLPALHAVTDDSVLARPDFLPLALAVLAAGGADVALHLRGPGSGGRFLYELAEPLARAADRNGALFVVNDRVDVALAVGAGGVQLGRGSMLAADARSILGDGPLVGVSVGSTAETRHAAEGGAAFVLAGSVYATVTHPGREGMGPGGLRGMAALGIPTVAIGGITPERVGEVRAAGARGVAAIRSVWEADDPARAVARFLEAWKDADN
ncbi:MAG TPA: thiamine phosphate synthase [Longimicrobiaceae bacterium]|nr:thiamine phosphate synthase [Longimicrobiaceae bacterium]